MNKVRDPRGAHRSEWGTQCRIEMVKRNMTFRELGAEVGITRAYASAIISGLMVPAREVSDRISKVLGVDPPEILNTK
jgi:transcriptional regulator with XRE-family HTH domain